MDTKPLGQHCPSVCANILVQDVARKLLLSNKAGSLAWLSKDKALVSLCNPWRAAWSKPRVDRLFGMAFQRRAVLFSGFRPCSFCPEANDMAPSANPWSLEPYTLCKKRCSAAKDCVSPGEQLGASYREIKTANVTPRYIA